MEWPAKFSLISGHLKGSLKEVRERGMALWGKDLPGKGTRCTESPRGAFMKFCVLGTFGEL